ncbi:KAP family P-loop NTPase fold protein [Roseibium litorale]|uniref:KAP NTPase domain-containing protein n=1 Tax=Roseibium litorale TaxID=2803841 RepID=A0ABR9CUX0_9HYPH|nr:P-loop NTPase fold protein [Roseibium litorale]MBD8894011.1 hypothetical protein [Roseibium litorale]
MPENTKEQLAAAATYAAANAKAVNSSAYAAAAGYAYAAANATYAAAYAANSATYAAAYAANSATYAASLQNDRSFIQSGATADALVKTPIWSADNVSAEVARLWKSSASNLLSRNEDWDVWTDWYEDRLAGNPPEDEALAVARVTLPEPMWKAGPKLVNAEIKNLIALNARGGAEAVEARMAELRTEYGEEAERPPTKTSPSVSQAQTNSPSLAEDGDDVNQGTEAAKEEDEVATDPDTRSSGPETKNAPPNVWILQYKPNDWTDSWTKNAVPEGELPWKSGKALPKALRAGDPVVYWRAIDPENREDRGGLVGIGTVISTGAVDESGIHRFPTRVLRFDDSSPIPRDEVTAIPDINWKNRPGSVLSLLPNQTKRLDTFLRDRGWPGLLPDQKPVLVERETHETPIRSDRPETSRDFLERAPLAFALATHVNHTWTAQTSASEKQELLTKWWQKAWHGLCRGSRACLDWLHMERVTRKTREPDEAAFILHIDSPWGGGKTTFANYLSRFLNRTAHGIKDDDPLVKNLRFGDWDKEFQDRRWFTVEFNAWQHEHVSPPWWNFYESIRRQTMQAILFEKGRCEGGPNLWRLLVWFRFLAFEWAWRIVTWQLVWTVLIISASAAGLYYFAQTKLYSDLMAAIGGQDDTTGTVFRAILGVSATGGAAVAILKAFRSGLQTIINSAGASTHASSLGVADPIQKFRSHFNWYMTQLRHPVLVVIDDLDRCSPKYVVELVRGLLTIFKSPRVVFVLLGDKDWIETAFAKVHKEMAEAHQDTQVSFGGRFAEKTIQLSFLLPVPSAGARELYLKELLGAEIAGQGGLTDMAEAPELEDAFKQINDRFSASETFAEQNEAARKGEEILRESVAKAPVEHQGALLEVGQTRIKQIKAQRAVTARGGQEEIKLHGLRPLKAFLPVNPRRIKRIINMVSAYQASAQATEGIDLGTDRWQQLVLWILIMCEYPNVWEAMVRSEDFTKALFDRLWSPDRQTEDEGNSEIGKILENSDLVQLLKGMPFSGNSEQPSPSALSAEAIVTLRRLTPVG